jgi:hypothetical protein
MDGAMGNTPIRKNITKKKRGRPCPLSYQNTVENTKTHEPFNYHPINPVNLSSFVRYGNATTA